jgi:ribosomal-protein-alanine N-acetyltransferase
MNIILETERLYLREFTTDDAQLLVDLNANPEVIKYVHELPVDIEKALDVLENIILPQYKLYNHGRWAVHLKENDEFIGWCGLKYVKERDEIDLGYRFFQQHWGKGYATESAKAAIDFGKNALQLPHIMAQAHVENIASQNVLEKCGLQFRSEGIVDNCPVKIYDLPKG